jgi:hypothetical protein
VCLTICKFERFCLPHHPQYVFCPAGWEHAWKYTTDEAKHLWLDVRDWVQSNNRLCPNEINDAMEVPQGAHAILRHTVYRASE